VPAVSQHLFTKEHALISTIHIDRNHRGHSYNPAIGSLSLSFSNDEPTTNAEWGSQTLRQACYRVKPESAMCVQNFDDSRGLAIRITYRISLRSSSLWEPRHPPLKVVYILDFWRLGPVLSCHCHMTQSEPRPSPFLESRI
jgi:hypothetical protein